MVSKRLTAFYLVCITIIFSVGLMLIDYGTSLKCLKECKSLDVYLQSLVFSRIEPRIAYHLGLTIVVFSYLLLTFLICIKL